jgi:precorrin-6B methylase 1
MPNIIICGAGLRTPDHLTTEVLEHLACADKIITTLPEAQIRLPGTLSQKLVSLWPKYEVGRIRTEVYEEQIRFVINQAANFEMIVYLCQGTPLFYDSVTLGLLQRAKIAGMGIKIYPGVSSLDCILIEAGRDIAPGLQLFDATSILLHNVKLDPRFDVLLLQIHVFGTALVAGNQIPRRERYIALGSYLKNFYAEDHIASFIRCALPGVTEARLDITVGLIGHAGDNTELPPGSSLFIPASTPRQADRNALANLTDRQSFNRTYMEATPHGRTEHEGN